MDAKNRRKKDSAIEAPAKTNTATEILLAEFNEVLRLEGRPDFAILERCPEGDRKELLSLMNVALLAYLALAPEREAFRRREPTSGGG
jgi:hypothetical protein